MRTLRSAAPPMASAICAASLLGAGCGDKTLSPAAAEKTARKQIPALRRELRVRSVNCPGDVEIRKGRTFECDISVFDQFNRMRARGTVTLRIVDDAGAAKVTRVTIKEGPIGG